MDVTLQAHGAKHIYRVPDGLRELCTDITREVLRSQPTEMYNFIADYIDALLITRENAKVAVRVVNNILRGSETIMSILYRTGLSIEQIAAAAPRLQTAFRAYLDIVDGRQPPCENEFDEKSIVSLREILENTGIHEKEAEKAAIVIQAAFRGHRTRMLIAQSQGKIQWQRALVNTLDILRKAGVPDNEITRSMPVIRAAYRGYYTQRNLRIQMSMDQKKEEEKTKMKSGTAVAPGETIQAVAWLEMIYEDSGLNVEIANNAALIIQRAYKKYRLRKGSLTVQRVVSSRTLVVEAIVDNLRQRVFDAVMSREDIPQEFGTREDMQKVSDTLQQMYKDRIRRSRISTEGEDEGETVEYEPEEIIKSEEIKESSETMKTEDERASTEDPTGEPINVEESLTTVEDGKIERDEHKEKEQEEQEVPHETTPASDTAGLRPEVELGVVRRWLKKFVL